MEYPSVEELRRWSAEEVMGWRLIIPDFEDELDHSYYQQEGKAYLSKGDWLPDNPETGQIWLVWNKISQKKNILCGSKNKTNFCEIREKSYPVPMNNFYVEDDNPCLAILRAAYDAVGRGEDGGEKGGEAR